MVTKLTRSAYSICILLASGAVIGHVGYELSADQSTYQVGKIEARRIDTPHWRPGATLAGYERVMILDPFVSFRKNWERNQNRDRHGASRVDAQDMERIRQALAVEFVEQFTRALEDDDGYEVVDTVGDDVLLLRPAIVNLDLTAPQVDARGRVDEYVTSAGEMTLYLELYDSATNAVIGRAVDRHESHVPGSIRVAGSFTNRTEADRILGQWATILRRALDDQWSGVR